MEKIMALVLDILNLKGLCRQSRTAPAGYRKYGSRAQEGDEGLERNTWQSSAFEE